MIKRLIVPVFVLIFVVSGCALKKSKSDEASKPETKKSAKTTEVKQNQKGKEKSQSAGEETRKKPSEKPLKNKKNQQIKKDKQTKNRKKVKDSESASDKKEEKSSQKPGKIKEKKQAKQIQSFSYGVRKKGFYQIAVGTEIIYHAQQKDVFPLQIKIRNNSKNKTLKIDANKFTLIDPSGKKLSPIKDSKKIQNLSFYSKISRDTDFHKEIFEDNPQKSLDLLSNSGGTIEHKEAGRDILFFPVSVKKGDYRLIFKIKPRAEVRFPVL